MGATEVEENLFAASDAKLHGDMCKALSSIYFKILSIFPSLEESRPRSRSGIQALCSLHITLEKAKNLLQHCSECSKLYLAITGDSVLLKFEKVKSALIDSLRRVEDIVAPAIGSQILEIMAELEITTFSVDPLEKQVGDEIIALLQQGRKFNDCSETNELEYFHQAATKLGISSSRAALSERRALKKLLDKARSEEDKRKESIVAYLLHLMRKYSKLFRSDLGDDNDSQGSSPSSPTVLGFIDDSGSGIDGHTFDKQFSKLGSFNFRLNNRRSGNIPAPPEELRCPISLQLMYDPVIIASGQTYERLCIEKWFSDGHDTCPKTQQKLPHLFLTPNYCVKGLINSWCEQNGVPLPCGPPESLDLNYWRLAMSHFESLNSRLVDNVSPVKLKDIKVAVPLQKHVAMEDAETEMALREEEDTSVVEETGFSALECYEEYLTILNHEGHLENKCRIVEHTRTLLKDDEEARIFLGANGFVEALLKFLESAIHACDENAQEVGSMALFNLAVNNNRNKELMLASGVTTLLEAMSSNPHSHGSATALYLNLSCLQQAKPVIGSSQAVSFLIQILQSGREPQFKLDALHALFNLSTLSSNIPKLLSAGILGGLQSILPSPDDKYAWTEKAIAVLINLATCESGKQGLMSTPSLISVLSTTLDIGEPIEQEQAAACLYILCKDSETCSQMVLQEGIIPALVSMSVNGTTRGREKAQKLLMLFREQRQQDQPPLKVALQRAESTSKVMPSSGSKPHCKAVSRNKMGKALSFFCKSKSYSLYQC